MNSDDPKSTLAQIRQLRIDKANKLRGMGIDPYPPKSFKTHSNKQIADEFSALENSEVVIAGRLMSWREHGHLTFGDVQDQSGTIQLYFKDDVLEATNTNDGTLGWSDLNLVDVGDIVEARGTVTKTQRGEISVTPKTFRILTKAIRPLPDKWKGLVDKEQRYRRRYLDMTMNTDVREMFERRAVFWDATREFLRNRGFYEVNIPVLEHTTGGADAKPFVTYMDAINESFYLRISHELPLKKLLGAGFEKVFDVGPRFRNEGMSDEHLPEHIAMEWYWAYADMNEGMELTKELFKFVLKKTFGTLKFNLKGQEVDLDTEWGVMDFADIIKERFGIDVFEDSEEKMLEELRKHTKDVDGAMNRSRLADSLWKVIRKDVVGPVFLTGVPKFLSPLSKPMIDDPRKTQRFQPIILGSEMANAFGELNDPIDQLDRFLEQQRMRESGDEEAHMLDIDFVEMLEYGMPPACGYGMSERVFWTFQGVTAKEGVPFPAMKREFENTTKEIYPEIDFEKMLTLNSVQESELEVVTHKPTTQDKSKRMVIVVSEHLSGWQLTNTIGHLSAYLGNKIANFVSVNQFDTKDGKSINPNSQYPVITMTAKPGQMFNLLQKVEELGLEHLAYIEDMITYSDDVELANSISTQNKEELKYIGIGIFGDNETLKNITKKFSLFK